MDWFRWTYIVQFPVTERVNPDVKGPTVRCVTVSFELPIRSERFQLLFLLIAIAFYLCIFVAGIPRDMTLPRNFLANSRMYHQFGTS